MADVDMPLDSPASLSTNPLTSVPRTILSVKQAADLFRSRRTREDDPNDPNKRPRQNPEAMTNPEATEGSPGAQNPPPKGPTPIIAELNDKWLSWGPEDGQIWTQFGTAEIFELLTELQHNDLTVQVETNPGRSLWLIIIDEPTPANFDDHLGRARQLTTAVTDLILRPIENPALVTATNPAPKQKTFHIYFLEDLSLGERNALVHRTFARANHATMHFLSPDNQFSDKTVFLGGVKGLDDAAVRLDNPEGSEAVKTHIKSCIKNAPAILEYIKGVVDKEACLNKLIGSLTFRAMRVRTGVGKSAMHYAIWFSSPFESQSFTLPFLKAIRKNLEVTNFFYHRRFGSGAFVEAWNCERCSSVDHFQTHCYFPVLNGWPGKPPTPVSYDAPPPEPVAEQRNAVFGLTDILNNNDNNSFVRSNSSRGRGRGGHEGGGNNNSSRGRGNARGRGRGRGRGT